MSTRKQFACVVLMLRLRLARRPALVVSVVTRLSALYNTIIDAVTELCVHAVVRMSVFSSNDAFHSLTLRDSLNPLLKAQLVNFLIVVFGVNEEFLGQFFFSNTLRLFVIRQHMRNSCCNCCN